MTEALRKKYPKWAHRKDERKRRRRKSRRRRRRSRSHKKDGTTTSTEGMLLSLLHQLMLRPATLAKKHGENVITGYADTVKPDSLAPVRSRYLMQQAMKVDEPGGGSAAGAGAAVGWRPFVYQALEAEEEAE